jgi:hypothetical protein
MPRPKVILFLHVATTLGLVTQTSAFESLRALLQPFGWLGVGRVIGILIVLHMLWFPWLFERLTRTKTRTEVLLREGKDPDEVIFLVATASCMTSTVVGLILYLLGASIIEFSVFAGLAIAGILFWAWRYRVMMMKPTS